MDQDGFLYSTGKFLRVYPRQGRCPAAMVKMLLQYCKYIHANGRYTSGPGNRA